MTIPIARFLTEFEPHPTPALIGRAAPALREATPEAAPPDVGLAEIEAARREDHRAVVAALEASFEARESALRASHAEELAAERLRWAETEGGALASRLAERLDLLENRIAAAAAAILEPLLPQALSQRTVDELRAAVLSLLANDDGKPVVIAGRADLVEAVRRSLGDRAGIRFEPADTPEVTIEAGDAAIHSSLQAWADGLAATLGAEP